MLKGYWQYMKEKRDYDHYPKLRSEMSYEEIVASTCENYNIQDWTINEDGLVDVLSDKIVLLNNEGLTEIPLKFGKVNGDFNLGHNKLTSLEGCPHTVLGAFSCYNNQLTSLKGGPKSVGGLRYQAGKNNITSFEGFPESHKSNMVLNVDGNPVFEVVNLFIPPESRHPRIYDPNAIKGIQGIVEWDVIDPDDMTISYTRLCEVFDDLGLDIPEREYIELEHYSIVD